MPEGHGHVLSLNDALVPGGRVGAVKLHGAVRFLSYQSV